MFSIKMPEFWRIPAHLVHYNMPKGPEIIKRHVLLCTVIVISMQKCFRQKQQDVNKHKLRTFLKNLCVSIYT